MANQVKTLQSIGQDRTGVTIDVLDDAEVEKLVKAGKPIDGLSQSRTAELIEMGAVEEVAEAAKPTKPAAKTATNTQAADTAE